MTPTKPVEIKALSGARAVPPLVLVLFHFCESHGYRGLPWFDLIVAKGYLWVEFFFALSGFVLVYVYGPRLRELWTWRGYFQFLWARLSRLYPLHLFMLAAILAEVIVFGLLAHAGGYVSIFDQPYHPVLTWQTFVASLFLVQAWNLFPYLSWNQISWFVSVEFLLCLSFPIYLRLAKARALGVILIAAGVFGLAFLDLTSGRGLDLTFHNGIWRGAAAFAIGVGSAAFFLTRHEAQSFSVEAHSAIQIGVLVALLGALWFGGHPKTQSDILTALPMVALVPALAADRGVLASVLKSKAVMKLGQWSYGIFIGQLFWMNLDRFAEQHLLPALGASVLGISFRQLAWWTEPACLVLLCVAWGAFLTIAIERPVNAALRWLPTRHGVQGASAA